MSLYQNQRSNIIRFAYLLNNFFIILLILFSITGTSILICSFVRPDLFSSVIVNEVIDSGYGLNFKICKSCSGEDYINLSMLDSTTKLWVLFRSLCFFIIVFLMLKTIRKVLKNMSSYSVFFEKNITHFKFLSKLTFGLVLISVFNVNFLNDTLSWHFTIPFKTIGLAFGFLVLSEIFKEGKTLLEDKNSII